MDQRVSFITLGVEDIAASKAFYERLGWKASKASQKAIVFFDLNGVVLGLFGRSALAADASIAYSKPSFSGVSLACNQSSEEAVDAVMAEAAAAGARIVKPAEKTFWGGYSGYFSDPDGHLWEIAHNPFAPLDEEKRVWTDN